jgi:hypothetical protein
MGPMTRGTFAAAVLWLSLAAPAAAQGPFAKLPPAPKFAGAAAELTTRLLEAHNRERAAVGSPPLVWDPYLAASAASYGPTLASLHQLVHSAREARPGQRENLAMAWHGTMTPEQLVGLWTAERRMMQPGIFPAVSSTGRWEDVAHYTQMVWPTTTHVGCAIFAADRDYLICRYSPPGNLDGKAVFAATPLQVAQATARTGN